MNLSLRKRIRKISSSFKKNKKDGEKGRIITTVESPAKIAKYSSNSEYYFCF